MMSVSRATIGHRVLIAALRMQVSMVSRMPPVYLRPHLSCLSRPQIRHSATPPKRKRKTRTKSASRQFQHACEACGTGCGTLPCFACEGQGFVNTKPGGAGRPFFIGRARCHACNGQGLMACPLCGGFEGQAPTPDPERGPPGREAKQLPEMLPGDLAWLDDL